MITNLKRGYTWYLTEDGKTVEVYDKRNGVEKRIDLDKVGQYSLLCFLIRVFRHRGLRKKLIKK